MNLSFDIEVLNTRQEINLSIEVIVFLLSILIIVIIRQTVVLLTYIHKRKALKKINLFKKNNDLFIK